MSSVTPARFYEQFAQQMQLPDAELELDRAALCLAGEEYPDLDIEATLGTLDALAAAVAPHLRQPDDQEELAQTLRRFLFEEAGFRGNQEDYYNPANSFLNRVLETRQGIPIALSVIYLEVGRRLGLACHGVGLPGHFVLRLDRLDLYLDCFNQGSLLSAADCRRLVTGLYGNRLAWREEYLEPYSKRDILFRMLTNLKHIYFERGQWQKAITAIRYQLLAQPQLVDLHKELSMCHLRRADYRLAILDLENYLSAASNPSDASQIKEQIQALWAAMSRLN